MKHFFEVSFDLEPELLKTYESDKREKNHIVTIQYKKNLI